MKQIDSEKGFTLLELLLYMAILTMMLATLVPYAWNIIGGGAKSNTQQEVFSQARFISDKIKYEIRNAVGINSVTATSLSLATNNVATNPTVIDSSGGNLRITQGINPPLNLNSTDVYITNIIFTNYSSSDLKTKNIGFVFTLNSVNSPRQEFTENTTVESDAEIRSN